MRPVFIVSPPRSGTSLLFETLARSPDLLSIGGESHQVIESVPGLHPAARIKANPSTGESEVVCELPGFTRGLAFAGPVVFVGLSQVREHVFADLPLGDRLPERLCGVWAIDVATGTTLGYVRFDGAVQKIFDVQLLRGTTYPELVEPEADLVSMAIQLPPEALADPVTSSPAPAS